MSYTVYYYKERKNALLGYRAQIPIAILLAILAISNGIHYFLSDYTDLNEQLFPWTQPEVQEAFSAFSEDLDDGKPIWDCLKDFCVEILNEKDENT